MSAIFHWHLQTISRSDGRSAVASAAYRAGARLVDERTGLTHDFAKRRGIVSEIVWPTSIAPLSVEPDAPAHALRNLLWNAAEMAERRCNSVVARELVVALPAALPLATNFALALRYCRALAERLEVVVDLAMHKPSSTGDARNHHAHIQFTTRRVGDGLKFGAKTRELDDARTGGLIIAELRRAWSDMVNDALANEGIDTRVDHRSLADRGIDREPAPHLGPVLTNIRIARERKIAVLDSEIDEIERQLAALLKQKEVEASPQPAIEAPAPAIKVEPPKAPARQPIMVIFDEPTEHRAFVLPAKLAAMSDAERAEMLRRNEADSDAMHAREDAERDRRWRADPMAAPEPELVVPVRPMRTRAVIKPPEPPDHLAAVRRRAEEAAKKKKRDQDLAAEQARVRKAAKDLERLEHLEERRKAEVALALERANQIKQKPPRLARPPQGPKMPDMPDQAYTLKVASGATGQTRSGKRRNASATRSNKGRGR